MATLEDRLLGEKCHYYCSSSESEEEDSSKGIINSSSYTSVPSVKDEGISSNTGPKGVIKDWQRFKQLEAEQRKEQEKEKIILAKKLALSCRSNLDDEREKEKEKSKEENADLQIEEQFLQQYILKRMEEMMKNTSPKKVFGFVLSIGSGEEFLEAVDKEDKDVTVVVHLFEPSVEGCEAMNGCLISLATDYPHTKFCCLQSSHAGLSRRFQGMGLPALLIYKSGQMIGNFVRLKDDLGDDFFASDVEAFLIEHGILLDKDFIDTKSKIIKESNTQEESDEENSAS